MKDIYRGSLVRFCNESPDLLAKTMAKWDRDTEQHRLADSDPAQLWSEKKLKEFAEKRREANSQSFRFLIHTLDEDKLIGGVGLWVGSWTYGDAWLGIWIGERDYWGRGCGTDAMRLFQKFGFMEEIRRRKALNRDGQIWDLVSFGLLNSEWREQTNGGG